MEITESIAKKVIKTVSCGLVNGIGVPEPGKMCVEAAVCYAMGLPHSDEPVCVSPAIRRLKITLNDSSWSSNEARAKGLLKLSVLQLGTNVDFDDVDFTKRVAEMVIRKIVLFAIRKAADVHPIEEHKKALNDAADLCEKEGSKGAAYAAARAAYAAYAAADAAARAADAADAAYAAYAAAKDEVLTLFATEVESILIEMNVPGVKWLDLIEQ